MDLAKLDEIVTDALRVHGGLCPDEHPVQAVIITTTLGCDDDGREFQLAVAEFEGLRRQGKRCEILGTVRPDDPRIGQPSPTRTRRATGSTTTDAGRSVRAAARGNRARPAARGPPPPRPSGARPGGWSPPPSCGACSPRPTTAPLRQHPAAPFRGPLPTLRVHCRLSQLSTKAKSVEHVRTRTGLRLRSRVRRPQLAPCDDDGEGRRAGAVLDGLRGGDPVEPADSGVSTGLPVSGSTRPTI